MRTIIVLLIQTTILSYSWWYSELFVFIYTWLTLDANLLCVCVMMYLHSVIRQWITQTFTAKTTIYYDDSVYGKFFPMKIKSGKHDISSVWRICNFILKLSDLDDNLQFFKSVIFKMSRKIYFIRRHFCWKEMTIWFFFCKTCIFVRYIVLTRTFRIVRKFSNFLDSFPISVESRIAFQNFRKLKVWVIHHLSTLW